MNLRKLYIIVAFVVIGLNCFGQTNQSKTDTTIFTVVEQMPQYSGGQVSMLKFI